MRHHFLSVVFLLLCSALPGRQNQSEVGGGEAISKDEYLVYAAALDWFVHRGLASQPLVADHTSTFSCATVCNGMKIGGCNGLRGDDESVEERMKITKRDLPQLSADSAQKFVAKNQRCSLIEQKIPTKTRYAIFGTTEPRSSPDGWDHPDYLFFSRVGFDARKTQALLYVGFMSGTDAAASDGHYLLLVKEAGIWKIAGLSIVWKLQS